MMNNKIVAVAIDKDKGSQNALKWTVDNLVKKGQIVYLLHVRIKPSFSFSQKPSKIPDFDEDSFLIDSDAQLRELFLPFRCFCTRKEIHPQEVLLEDSDVTKGLLEFVTRSIVEVLIVGTPLKGGLLKRFKSRDIPGAILKGVPNFCTVYVISKGRISATKSASCPPPYVSPLRALAPSQPSVLSSAKLRPINTTKVMPMPRMSVDSYYPKRSTDSSFNSWSSDSNIMKSGLTNKRSLNSKPYGELLPPNTDMSFISSGRMSVDSIFPSFESELSPVQSRISFSEFDNQGFRRSVDVNMDVTYSSLDSPRTSVSSNTEDVEEEMRRLKLELSRTMEMYSTACREALTARQKAMELQKWKLAEQQKVEESGDKENTNSTNIYDVRYRRYTIEEIEEATNNFSTDCRIGEGDYGPVYKCHLDHTPVAIKVLQPDASEGKSQFQKEVEVLCCIRHPHMVLLLGACPENGCLVYEYMQNGSLEDYLLRKNRISPLSWQHRFRIAAEICSGLLFLHQTKPEPIVHRDLKPANILLDRNFVSKISNVGLVRLMPPSVQDSVTQHLMTSAVETFCYIDPEYQETGVLDVKSDVYSLGVMFLQLITAKSPTGLTHHVEQAITKGTFTEMLDPGVPDWPVEEALGFAKLSLLCAELRRKDRPELGKDVMPELERLRSLADESM